MADKKHVVEISSDPFVKAFTDLSELLNDVTFNNVIFQVENKSFHANKALLAKHSPYFRSMFGGNFAESKSTEIELKMVKATSFQQILKFCYSGTFEISAGQVIDLWKDSVFFEMDFISKKCFELATNQFQDQLLDLFVATVESGHADYMNQTKLEIHNIIDTISASEKFYLLSLEHLLILLENFPQNKKMLFLSASLKWILKRASDDNDDLQRVPDILDALHLENLCGSAVKKICDEENASSFVTKHPSLFGKLLVSFFSKKCQEYVCNGSCKNHNIYYSGYKRATCCINSNYCLCG